MCGLAGFFQPAGFGESTGKEIVEDMARVLAHRGPDDAGSWVDGAAGIALGHRRLAILDLSPAGHQPMLSPSGRYVIVFNGEIYNHSQLRAELGGPRRVVARSFRHGDAACRHRALGDCGHAQQERRHVRVRACGTDASAH